MWYRKLSTCFLALTFALSSVALAAAPVQFRGPDGPIVAGSLPKEAFGLREGWTRDLGSGYSHIWIEGDRAVTMFAAGELDVVAPSQSSIMSASVVSARWS